MKTWGPQQEALLWNVEEKLPQSFSSSPHLGCTGSPFSTLLVSTTMNQIYVLIIYQIYVLNSVYASI